MNVKILTLGVILAHNVSAAPTLYPRADIIVPEIINHTTSNTMVDSEQSNRIYVMPPNSGTAEITGLHTLTANIGFCKEMGDLQDYSKMTTSRIFELSQKAKIESERLDNMIDAISSERMRIAEFAGSNNMVALNNLIDRLSIVEKKIDEITTKLDSCGDNCQVLLNEYRELNSERKELLAKKRELESEAGSNARILSQMNLKIRAMEDEMEIKDRAYNRLFERITTLSSQFFNLYRKFGELEGGRTGIVYSSEWDNNVQTLRDFNPGIDFQKIETRNAQITSALLALRNAPISGAAILDYEIDGILHEKKITYPHYPENLSANLRLSLIGACPILHPDYFDINVAADSKNMKYGLIITYEYPSLFNASVTVKYNMYKMYQKVVTSIKKNGGFFRKRKSTTSVSERNEFQDSFRVVWKDESSRLTDEFKADKERDMRTDIFMRLAAIAIPNVSNAGALALPDVPPSGATVLADGLMKTCPNNGYCKGAALAANVLDALFGSSQATTSYTNEHHVDMTEEWSDSQVLWRSWSTSYN